MTTALPKSILFACTHNMVRSPMAELIMRDRFAERVEVHSCGVDVGAADGFTQAVMEEIGLGLDGHESKNFGAVAATEFDLVVAFSDDALEEARRIWDGKSTAIEHWPVYDPAITSENRQMRLAAYRGVRDTIAGLIDLNFAPRGKIT